MTHNIRPLKETTTTQNIKRTSTTSIANHRKSNDYQPHLGHNHPNCSPHFCDVVAFVHEHCSAEKGIDLIEVLGAFDEGREHGVHLAEAVQKEMKQLVVDFITCK